ncbi:MAG: hypothetical protein K2N36_02195, partial [Ruminiclostridium sp.]|nr:hypothetical protein [Ruminiclostridium sp.]
GTSWLLYADRDSDTFMKLCGRPDCTHSDENCNAFFKSASSICYYDGFLYTFDDNDDIIRINLDGTERVSVYNIESFAKAGGYDGRFGMKILNGVFMIDLIKVNENGLDTYNGFFYKLDGSMDKLQPTQNTFDIEADGEVFFTSVYNKDNNSYTYNIWDPDKGIGDELFKAEEPLIRGYIGTKAEYHIEDGVIIENSYAEGGKELIDTGLKGNYQLACFPDCMVVYEFLSYEDLMQGSALEEVTLHFYDWKYNDLGSVKINYEFHQQDILNAGIICGETPERIMLTDNSDFAPRYFINKSDFGSENIEIHSFNLPDDLNN